MTKTKTKTKTGKISYMPPPLILIKKSDFRIPIQKNNPTRQKKWWLDFFQKQ